MSQPPPIPSDADVTIAPTGIVAEPVKPVGEGQIMGPYQLVRWLGSGGMGTVWEAVETKTGRRVALKRLAKNMACDTTYVQRFNREAQLVAQISHPNVTFVYGTGNECDQPYIAMELMPGKTLEDKVEQDGPMAMSLAMDNMLDVVDGLIAAHRLGMIHRDVKPSNCFVGTDDSVKIGDFGLSKSLLENDVHLTQTGTFMGTPSYAAPEQIRGAELDGRTDVYSVGATMFYLFTGRTPFKGDAMSVTAQIITDKPPPVRQFNKSIPKDLESVIAKCLDKDPAKRFQDLTELRRAMLPFASQRQSIAEIGRRVAAYMIDQCLIEIVTMIGIMVAMIAVSIQLSQSTRIRNGQDYQAAMQELTPSVVLWGGVFSWLGTILYYAILEGRLGRALGKRLMGLHVVNREGQRAGFWRVALRAFLVPGCVGIPLVYNVWYAKYGHLPVSAPEHMLAFIQGTLVTLAPVLICISTMRVSNGLLGIQGMVSQTKVIRWNTGKQKVSVPVVQPKLNTIDLMQFGPYQTRELLGESEFGKVYLGRDEPLKRDVWIVERQSGTEPCSERINLARVSRQRWLEGGDLPDGRRWDAFEAIHGVPVQTFVGIDNQADWTHFRQVLLDIVDEVRQSSQDGTLPDSLSLPQVWLDRDGHAKLLDKQLVNVVAAQSTPQLSTWLNDPVDGDHQNDSTENAVQLIQELGDLFCRTKILPSSAQDFIKELKNRPKTESTLQWASDELKSSGSKSIGNLAWDSRLGVLGATVGIELVLYGLISGLLFLVCFYVIPLPNQIRFFLGATLGLAVPVIFGSYFCGGPVFRFMGIQVCNSRGRPAKPFTCAMRTAISWLPVIAMLGGSMMLLMLAETANLQVEPELGSLAYDLKHVPLVGLAISVVFLFSILSVSFGLLFAMLSPKRGLVDYFLRTQLMPK